MEGGSCWFGEFIWIQFVLVHMGASQIFIFVCTAFGNSWSLGCAEIAVCKTPLFLAAGQVSVTLLASFLAASTVVNPLPVKTERWSKMWFLETTQRPFFL